MAKNKFLLLTTSIGAITLLAPTIISCKAVENGKNIYNKLKEKNKEKKEAKEQPTTQENNKQPQATSETK
ncbi:hypothetical protein [Mesomycoplasma molare]|uniref:Lipoprotein n=1 Tax=Mesomycoplasma molare TaxID=171288 RepID=A0ABY5TTQ6_9BACT|nr:hypothetical protein [Mesomycoplasma molare]UWD34047.1 hypothetical protein NX772_02990 [Mesomycoplasma molare]